MATRENTQVSTLVSRAFMALSQLGDLPVAEESLATIGGRRLCAPNDRRRVAPRRVLAAASERRKATEDLEVVLAMRGALPQCQDGGKTIAGENPTPIQQQQQVEIELHSNHAAEVIPKSSKHKVDES